MLLVPVAELEDETPSSHHLWFWDADVKFLPVVHTSMFRFVYGRYCQDIKKWESFKSVRVDLLNLTTDPSIPFPNCKKSPAGSDQKVCLAQHPGLKKPARCLQENHTQCMKTTVLSYDYSPTSKQLRLASALSVAIMTNCVSRHPLFEFG